ncbi:MAG: leucine-rich repeat domain-containing protein [Salinivirgaceae bacterium]|nr:leucine-rich repeat domain-containing protein [Salinivirgaceae bacterium]MBO7496640.1 leucine-rich repeat domain-containing protein [Salinivirgaceae bacterium]
MKRLITLFAAIAFAGQAWAQDFKSGDLYYNITSDSTVEVTYEIYADENNYSGLTNAIIPETVTDNGVTYSVSSIGRCAFDYCSGLTSVTIPNSVNTIGDCAFAGCYGLTSLTIPGSVNTIGYGAFYDCNGLTSVIIPNSVQIIEKQAFSGCDKLTRVEFHSVESLCKIKFAAIDSNPLFHTEHLYINGVEVTEVVIPEGVVSIGDYAFIGCKGLTSVIIPNSVTNIGLAAFFGCEGLVSIAIPESVTTIENETFMYCFNLSSVDIPNSVTKIGRWAFFYSGLKSVEIPNSVTEIGEDAFLNAKNIVYSGEATGSPWGALTVNGIIDNGFVYYDAEKTKLTAYIGEGGDVTIPETVTSIGTDAFYNCSDIATITIPITVDSIGRYAFYGCTATINCMVEKRPKGWDWDWCGGGYEGEIVWKTATPVIESAANAVNIYAYGRNIVVENASDEICVYDAMGKLICRDAIHRVRTELNVKNTGVYIVKVGNTAKRVVIY